MPDFTRIFAESGLKNTIGDTEYDGGWDDIVGSNPPSYKDFNSIMNEQDSKLADIAQTGVVYWDANIPYQDGAWARSAVDNAVYELLPSGDPTNEPSASPADWKQATTSDIEAVDVTYDNASSGITATNVQSAIDEVLVGALGVGQTWQDVTGSRSSGVTYTNTTGKTISVSITALNSGTGAVDITILLNGVQLQRDQVNDSTGFGYLSSNFIVPSGATYQASSITASLSSWFELR